MPILDIALVGPVPMEVRRNLARRLADATGEALGSRPQGTWVKLRFLDSDAYAENSGGPPEDAQPVIVSVLQAQRPRGAELSELAFKLTQAIASACQRPPQNVHLIFEPDAAGRIAFGGQVRE
jgi:phenylpyruvate tautomerase PptA (4-oxalocrotonate tautomerase family)